MKRERNKDTPFECTGIPLNITISPYGVSLGPPAPGLCLIYRPDQTRPRTKMQTDQTRPRAPTCDYPYGMIKCLMHFNDPFNAHINGAHTWYVIYDGSCYLMPRLMPFCTACECTCHCLFCQHKHVVMMISIAKIHYRTVTSLRSYYRDIHKSS